MDTCQDLGGVAELSMIILEIAFKNDHNVDIKKDIIPNLYLPLKYIYLYPLKQTTDKAVQRPKCNLSLLFFYLVKQKVTVV